MDPKNSKKKPGANFSRSLSGHTSVSRTTEFNQEFLPNIPPHPRSSRGFLYSINRRQVRGPEAKRGKLDTLEELFIFNKGPAAATQISKSFTGRLKNIIAPLGHKNQCHSCR